ncbi:hypothetical protein PR202_ga16492 [Eleusine coracana subsp. coracana]|uniref:Uncharacterized protein n=1 Tax=Eleusine coracana subsp. coracana TaxID=191504 RepID=A0AAV5CLN6_ELECO|nr:hypothetical protein QOZ80_6AG0527820 [Eleusine coracana subsp. coracana]GJM99398.1 hypothetical protein PR202_ga16492 [Eleusine coracana subsp. coracana]
MASSSSTPPARGWGIETQHGAGLFTEAELAAADQLVQLSGSGGGWDDEASPSSSSSSPRSVNTAAVAWEEGEQEVVALAGPAGEELDRRARKRYRLLSDLYAATKAATGACLLGATTTCSARKRKRHGEPDGKAAMPRYDGDQSF